MLALARALRDETRTVRSMSIEEPKLNSLYMLHLRGLQGLAADSAVSWR